MSFHSHEQLVAAGFLFRDKGTCHRCGQVVLFYSHREKGYRMMIEPITYESHRAACRKGHDQEGLFS